MTVRAGQDGGKGRSGTQKGVGQGQVGAWELGLEVLMPLDNK